MTKFLRTEKGRYVYSFECPCCGAIGEIGLPVRSQCAVDHGCGQLYIQTLPSGIFNKPRLLEVNLQQGGRA